MWCLILRALFPPESPYEVRPVIWEFSPKQFLPRALLPASAKRVVLPNSSARVATLRVFSKKVARHNASTKEQGRHSFELSSGLITCKECGAEYPSAAFSSASKVPCPALARRAGHKLDKRGSASRAARLSATRTNVLVNELRAHNGRRPLLIGHGALLVATLSPGITFVSGCARLAPDRLLVSACAVSAPVVRSFWFSPLVSPRVFGFCFR